MFMVLVTVRFFCKIKRQSVYSLHSVVALLQMYRKRMYVFRHSQQILSFISNKYILELLE
jgi:hypothetical protein